MSSGSPENHRASPRGYLIGAILASVFGFAAWVLWTLLNGMSHSGLRHWSVWYTGSVALIFAAPLYFFAARRIQYPDWRRPALRGTTYVLSLMAAAWGGWGIWTGEEHARSKQARLEEPSVGPQYWSADNSSFVIPFQSATSTVDGQLWDVGSPAKLPPEPAPFRLWIAAPGLSATVGSVVRAELRRGDSAVASVWGSVFGQAFGNRDSLVWFARVDTTSRPAALPLLLTVRGDTVGQRPWVVEAQLPNGGRFWMSLYGDARRARIRRFDPETDPRAYLAMVGFFGP